MRSLIQNATIVLGLVAAAPAWAQSTLTEELSGHTFFIRNRSFKAGAPAGWTNVEFTGVAGSDLINGLSLVTQSVLRLHKQNNANKLYPDPPQILSRGTVVEFETAARRLTAERTTLEQTVSQLDSSFKDLDAELRTARLDLELRRLRVDFLAETARTARLESEREPGPASEARVERINEQITRAQWPLLKAELVVNELVQKREAKLTGANTDLRERLNANAKALSQLTGFYVGENIDRVKACARPLVFRSADGAPINPFFPDAKTESSLGSLQLAVCVNNSALQAVYVLDAKGNEVARSLFGRDAAVKLDRIIIRDARGAMLEDYQYLPGPKGTTRFGLTFRRGDQMTSIYTDVDPR